MDQMMVRFQPSSILPLNLKKQPVFLRKKSTLQGIKCLIYTAHLSSHRRENSTGKYFQTLNQLSIIYNKSSILWSPHPIRSDLKKLSALWSQNPIRSDQKKGKWIEDQSMGQVEKDVCLTKFCDARPSTLNNRFHEHVSRSFMPWKMPSV